MRNDMHTWRLGKKALHSLIIQSEEDLVCNARVIAKRHVRLQLYFKIPPGEHHHSALAYLQKWPRSTSLHCTSIERLGLSCRPPRLVSNSAVQVAGSHRVWAQGVLPGPAPRLLAGALNQRRVATCHSAAKRLLKPVVNQTPSSISGSLALILWPFLAMHLYYSLDPAIQLQA